MSRRKFLNVVLSATRQNLDHLPSTCYDFNDDDVIVVARLSYDKKVTTEKQLDMADRCIASAISPKVEHIEDCGYAGGPLIFTLKGNTDMLDLIRHIRHEAMQCLECDGMKLQLKVR